MGADLILCHYSRLEEREDLGPTDRFDALVSTLPPARRLYDPYGHSSLNRLGMSWLTDIKAVTGVIHVYEESGHFQFVRGMPLPTCERLLDYLRTAEVRTGTVPISAETRERVGLVIQNDWDPDRLNPPPLPFRSISEGDRMLVEGWRHEAIAFLELALAEKEMPLCSL